MEKKLNYNVTSKNFIDDYFYFMVVEQNKVTKKKPFSKWNEYAICSKQKSVKNKLPH